MPAKKENKLPWYGYGKFYIPLAIALGWVVFHYGISAERFNATKSTNSTAKPFTVEGEEFPDPKDGEISYEDLDGKIVPVSKFNGKTRQYEPLDLVNTEPSYNQISPNLVKVAETGNPVCQWQLGNEYFDGKKVHRNYGEAVKWWTKAANQGNEWAQLDLAECYIWGKGVALDRKKGVQMLRLIIEKSKMTYFKALAMYRLSFCYFNGFGVTKNFDEGTKWLRKSAEMGFPNAQHDLGNAYLNGFFKIPKDEEQGRFWLKRSKESEDSMEKVSREWKDSGFERAIKEETLSK